MKLENRIRALIAVGASVATNCLQSTMTMALETGADEQEIAEAIGVGKRVRIGAASKMDEFALSLNHPSLVAESASDSGCGCG